MTENHSMIKPTEPLAINDSLTMVATAKKFLSSEECQNIIEMSSCGSFDKGTIGQLDHSSIRKSEVICMRPNDDNMWLFERLELAIKQMNNAYNYQLTGFYEGVQIATYKESGKYDWHIDIGPGENSRRKLSMSIQLTDPDEYVGGDLQFMNIDQVTERQRGALIGFPSFLQHRVTPVSEGLRYSLVAWVHGKPFA